MYLKYNNSSGNYICTAESIENDIRIIFAEEFETNTGGFKLFSDSGVVLGDYSDYTVIKASYADGFLFSQNGEEVKETQEKEETLGEKLQQAVESIEELKKQIEEIESKMLELPAMISEHKSYISQETEKITKLTELNIKISKDISQEEVQE